ncbi:MAG: YveK family protein [Sarcina sp.]
MQEEVIKIEDILQSLKKRWLMIVLITLTSAIVAGVISFYVIKPQYQAGVKVFIGKEGSTSKEAQNYNNSDIEMYQNLMKTYAELVKSKDSVSKALTTIGEKNTQANINRVLAGLTVTPGADTQIIEVKYTTTDKSEILPVINSVMKEFIESSGKLIPNGNVKIIEKPIAPTSPIAPNKKLNILIGFMLGLMISLGIVFLLEYLNNTVKNSNELELAMGLPVIGAIPQMKEIALTKKEKKQLEKEAKKAMKKAKKSK